MPEVARLARYPDRMDEPVDPAERPSAFRLARKGYERPAVDAFLEANAEQIAALERKVADLEAGMSALGLDGPVDLAAELDIVGEEVKRVLQEARVAAEQMRSRAADDAARWRAEADAESRRLRDEARSVAFDARKAAWEAGSAMLAAASEQRDAILSRSTEQALFTQAEAERVATRLVGDAKRERDEAVRTAREDAERTLTAARQESEALLAAARREAAAAEERARALETRRIELMAELEAAKATIAGRDPEPVVPAEVVGGAATGEKPEVGGDAQRGAGRDEVRTHWPDDEGSVKIVAPGRAFSAVPVDPDAFVAEVAAMREQTRDARHETRGPEGVPEPEPASVLSAAGRRDAEEQVGDDGGGAVPVEDAEVPAPEPEPAAEVIASAEDAREPTTEPTPDTESEPEPEPELERGHIASAEDAREPTNEPTPDTESEPEPELEPERGHIASAEDAREPTTEETPDTGYRTPDTEEEPAPDPLASLFAELRTPESVAPTVGRGGAEEPAGDEAGGTVPAPKPFVDAVPDTEYRVPSPSSDDATVEDDRAAESGPDPFELRDRLLLPVQNRALRMVKRQLVEAQNQALEDLRLTDGWEPDEAIISNEAVESLTRLSRESMVAGFAAAAELMGADVTPQPEHIALDDHADAFVGELVAAARSSLVRSREAGAGHRETSSALSRVFRAWRTDEAERRVRYASYGAYHAGLAAALADLGAARIEVKPSGRPCAECPATAGPWPISEAPPGGTLMPPARLTCACTIVPSP